MRWCHVFTIGIKNTVSILVGFYTVCRPALGLFIHVAAIIVVIDRCVLKCVLRAVHLCV